MIDGRGFKLPASANVLDAFCDHADIDGMP
jgi:hypothetical protein